MSNNGNNNGLDGNVHNEEVDFEEAGLEEEEVVIAANADDDEKNGEKSSTITKENIDKSKEKSAAGGIVPNVLFLSRYGRQITRLQIYTLMQRFGPVIEVTMHGVIAFVEFERDADAALAKKTLHLSADLGTDSLIVDFKKDTYHGRPHISAAQKRNTKPNEGERFDTGRSGHQNEGEASHSNRSYRDIDESRHPSSYPVPGPSHHHARAEPVRGPPPIHYSNPEHSDISRRPAGYSSHPSYHVEESIKGSLSKHHRGDPSLIEGGYEGYSHVRRDDPRGERHPVHHGQELRERGYIPTSQPYNPRYINEPIAHGDYDVHYYNARDRDDRERAGIPLREIRERLPDRIVGEMYPPTRENVAIRHSSHPMDYPSVHASHYDHHRMSRPPPSSARDYPREAYLPPPEYLPPVELVERQPRLDYNPVRAHVPRMERDDRNYVHERPPFVPPPGMKAHPIAYHDRADPIHRYPPDDSRRWVEAPPRGGPPMRQGYGVDYVENDMAGKRKRLERRLEPRIAEASDRVSTIPEDGRYLHKPPFVEQYSVEDDSGEPVRRASHREVSSYSNAGRGSRFNAKPSNHVDAGDSLQANAKLDHSPYAKPHLYPPHHETTYDHSIIDSENGEVYEADKRNRVKYDTGKSKLLAPLSANRNRDKHLNQTAEKKIETEQDGHNQDYQSSS